MNVLSLFDGISCGMLALKKINKKITNYYASEIDESAIKISRNNFPEIVRLGDINNINADELKKLPKIDLILGGSPCQGFSRQGNSMNFKHSESKLFFNFVNILNWIKENNNKDVLFLLENVKMKKEWSDTITKYVNVNPIDINSALLSAQNRPRTYWTNIKGITEPVNIDIKLKNIIDKNINTSGFLEYKGILIDKRITKNELKLIDVVDGELRISQATKNKYIIANDGDGVNLSFPSSKTRRGRVIKNKSHTLDRSCNICVYHDCILRKLNINELEQLQALPRNYTRGVSDTKRKSVIGNAWTVDVIAYILSKI